MKLCRLSPPVLFLPAPCRLGNHSVYYRCAAAPVISEPLLGSGTGGYTSIDKKELINVRSVILCTALLAPWPERISAEKFDLVGGGGL